MEQWLAQNPPDFPDVFDFAQYITDNKDKLDKGKRPEQRADGSYVHPAEFPQEYCTLLERTWVLSDMMNSATKSGKTNQMSTYEAAHIKVLKELLQAILRTNDILTAAVSLLLGLCLALLTGRVAPPSAIRRPVLAAAQGWCSPILLPRLNHFENFGLGRVF